MQLADYIREIPDWPKPGVRFKDITPLLQSPSAFAMAIEQMANPFRSAHIDLIVAAESRGFIFGTALAQSLSAGFVPLRKPNKLPWRTHQIDYHLEYHQDTLEVHQDAIQPHQRALFVDDVLATGGTMVAACDLVRKLDCTFVGATCLIELTALGGRQKVEPHIDDIHVVITY